MAKACDKVTLSEMAADEGTSETSRLVSSNSTSKPSYLNLVTNVCAIVFIGIIIYCCFKDGASLFAFHPTLMAVGVSESFYLII